MDLMLTLKCLCVIAAMTVFSTRVGRHNFGPNITRLTFIRAFQMDAICWGRVNQLSEVKRKLAETRRDPSKTCPRCVPSVLT